MTSSDERPWLPDVNLWIALASNRHEHHSSARIWFEAVAGAICFCRVNQMGLSRLLTNSRVMGEDVLTPVDAWIVYEQFLSASHIRFASEPLGVENAWMSFMTVPGVVEVRGRMLTSRHLQLTGDFES